MVAKRAATETVQKKKKNKKTGGHGTLAKKKKNEKNYSIESMQAALNAMGEGQTLRQAAHNFGVPKSTLFLKSKNQIPLECRKGPKTILSAEVERDIELWIIFCADSGFPVTKSRLLDCVQNYLRSDKINTPFKNNRPGQHWYRAFMKRHPNLSTRIAQNLTCTRAAVTEEDLREWFSKVKRYLEEKNLLNIEPHRVFNLDESAFMLVPKDNKVITEKGTKAPYQIVSGNEKASLTVLFTTAASGIMPPPMILFDLKTSPKKSTLDQIPKGWGVGNTERGWMTAESFYSYISNVFYKWLRDNNYVFPIVLYVDGHSSHMTLPLLQFCKDHLIELIVLYPNATHIIQPLDVAIFHPLKDSYRKVLRQWRIDNNIIDVKKHMFAPVLKMALDSHDLTSAAQNGFRACGLYPFDANAVNYNILSKKRKKTDSSVEPRSTNVDQNSVAKNAELLDIFEKKIISPAVLESFKQAELESKWNGAEAYVALFESWRKLKKLFSGVEIEMCDAPSTESTVIDGLSLVDEQIPHDNLTEGRTTDITPEIADNTMLDASVCLNDQLNLSAIETVFPDSGHPAIQAGSRAPESEIELYDELGNRITATLVTLIDEGMGRSNQTSSIKTIVPTEVTSNLDAKVDSQLVVKENSDDTDKTASDRIVVDVGNTNPHEIKDSNSNSNKESRNSHSSSMSNKEIKELTMTSTSTNKFNNTLNGDQENPNDSDEVAVSKVTDTLEQASPVSGIPILVENNSINVIKNDETINLGINGESNSSTCSSGNKTEPHISSKLVKFFPVPTFTGKKKKKATSTNTPSVAVVDDLLVALQQKEAEKKEKEKQILLNKRERERAKTMREKETSVVKQYNESKKRKQQNKKELKSQIQNLKRSIKSKSNRENIVPLTEQLNKLNTDLAELENSLIAEEMDFLQTKIKIKKEKCDENGVKN